MQNIVAFGRQHWFSSFYRPWESMKKDTKTKDVLTLHNFLPRLSRVSADGEDCISAQTYSAKLPRPAYVRIGRKQKKTNVWLTCEEIPGYCQKYSKTAPLILHFFLAIDLKPTSNILTMKMFFFSLLNKYSRTKPNPVCFDTLFGSRIFLRVNGNFCEKLGLEVSVHVCMLGIFLIFLFFLALDRKPMRALRRSHISLTCWRMA